MDARKKKEGAVLHPRGTVVYVTKYAMSTGVVRTVLRDDHVEGDRMLNVRFEGGIGGMAVFSLKDLYWSEADALTQAEHMRTVKLEQLAKNMRSLRSKKVKVRDQVPTAEGGANG